MMITAAMAVRMLVRRRRFTGFGRPPVGAGASRSMAGRTAARANGARPPPEALPTEALPTEARPPAETLPTEARPPTEALPTEALPLAGVLPDAAPSGEVPGRGTPARPYEFMRPPSPVPFGKYGA